MDAALDKKDYTTDNLGAGPVPSPGVRVVLLTSSDTAPSRGFHSLR
jgi:hypothetical protein